MSSYEEKKAAYEKHGAEKDKNGYSTMQFDGVKWYVSFYEKGLVFTKYPRK